MHNKAGFVRYALFAVLCLVVASCSTIYRNHGYVPTEEQLSEITVGRDSKESVAAAIGRPSTSGVLDQGAWYYVESRFLHSAYRRPKEIERQVLAISFDTRGTVRNIERFGLQDGQVVTLSRRVTESSVRNTVFLRQLFGNLGRFNPAGLFGE